MASLNVSITCRHKQWRTLVEMEPATASEPGLAWCPSCRYSQLTIIMPCFLPLVLCMQSKSQILKLAISPHLLIMHRCSTRRKST